MKQMKKSFAVLFAISFFIAILFSDSYISLNAHHDCSGADCPICLHLEQASHFLFGMRPAAATVCSTWMLCMFVAYCCPKRMWHPMDETLISLKVELWN